MKNLFKLIAPLFLLGPVLCSPPCGDGEDPEEAMDVVVRRYPIPAGLLGGRGIDQVGIQIWPASRIQGQLKTFEFEDGLNVQDEVADLVRTVLADTFDFHPECWLMAMDGELLVGVDAENHALLAEFFAFLNAVWGQPLRLQLTRIPSDAAGGLQVGLVDNASARQVTRNPEAASRVISLDGGRTIYLAPEVYSSVTIAVDCEVASGMATSVPVRGIVPSGEELRLSAGRVEGGISLSMLNSRSQLTEMGQRDLLISTRMTLEGKQHVSTLQEGMPLDSYTLRTACVAADFFLPNGQALVLKVGAGLKSGGESELLIIQHLDGGAQPMTQAQLSNGWRLAFMPMNGFAAPTLNAHLGLEPHVFAMMPTIYDYEGEGGFLSVLFEENDLEDLVLDACADEQNEVRSFGGGILIVSNQQPSTEFAAGFDLVRGLGRPRTARSLGVRLFDGDDLMEEAQLHVQEGLRVVLGLGDEHLVYPEANGEIAHSATAPAFYPALSLEGLALTARVVVQSSGTPAIVMRGLACKTEDRKVSPGPMALYSSLDRPRVSVLPLDGVHLMTASADGGWTLSLEGGGALRLEVSLR